MKTIAEPQSSRCRHTPIEKTREHLKKIMPEEFFSSVSPAELEEILPLVVNIGSADGIRRAECGRNIFIAYLRSRELNTTVTGWELRGRTFHSLRISQSIGRIDSRNLVIEHYRLADPTPAEPCFSFEEIRAAAGVSERDADELRDLYERLNWGDLRRIPLAGIVRLALGALEMQKHGHVRVEASRLGGKRLALSVMRSCPTGDGQLFDRLADHFIFNGFSVRSGDFHLVSHGAGDADFSRRPVAAAEFVVEFERGKLRDEDIRRLVDSCRLVNWAEVNDLFQFKLVMPQLLSFADANLVRAIAEFIHSQLAYVDRHTYSLENIHRYLARYPRLLGELAKIFRRRFDPESPAAGRPLASGTMLRHIGMIATGITDNDRIIRTIFSSALNFIENIRLTNFFCADKSALAFRLAPEFMDFYAELSPEYLKAFPADRPCGVFFFYRQETIGFQIRFDEIARGGWRSVIPAFGASELERFDLYDYAKDEIFREVYVLAHTQHLKNKDIFEGGSKMITLLRPAGERDFRPRLWESQRAVCAAFMSLINYDEKGRLRDPRIVDALGSPEIIEIGPDEKMFDPMIEWMGAYAARQGYSIGSGLISGKPGSGFNHKEYGVTSFGVYRYLLKTVSELGIDPVHDEWSVRISGGPSGDVAGNLLKLLIARDEEGNYRHPGLKILSIVDGPAAVSDPAGIDREELRRLLFSANLDGFSPECLHGEGAGIIYSTPLISHGEDRYRFVTRSAAGELVEKHLLRDEYMRRVHLMLAEPAADVFLPCGGRPSTINRDNVAEFLPGARPTVRAVVEGANSFLTPEARETLEQAGVWVIKDASANKCGVITSSYEILSGLMLDEAEFAVAKPELVPEVMAILRRRADDEAAWLFYRFRTTGTPMTRLTEVLSCSINAKNRELRAFLEKHPEMVTDELVLDHLPPWFRKNMPERVRRIPESYRRAIVSVELASRIIYRLDGNIENEIAAVTAPGC